MFRETFLPRSVLCLAISLFSGCVNPEEKARSILNQSLTLEREGKSDEAKKLLEKLVKDYQQTQAATEANQILSARKIIDHVSALRAAKTQIIAFKTALMAYRLDVGRFPRNDEGLQALILKPVSVSTKWDGPYLPKKIHADPWSRAYVYKFPGQHGEEPDIFSYGADGKEGGEGENADICSWTLR
jgi:general secretion pathway protein G